MLPALLVSVPLGITIFCLVAALLGVALFGLGAILHLTGPIATGLGLTWFGGSSGDHRPAHEARPAVDQRRAPQPRHANAVLGPS